MEPLFVTSFWITVIMLWVALVILYFILTNRKSLQRKGHHEKYINYLRKSHLIRICIIAFVLPVLILVSAWIVSKITGHLISEAQLGYIVIVLIILVIPFKFMDERINQKRIRELALDTKEKVAIDLKYKTLHLIFNPALEVVLGISALLYGVLFLRIEQWIVYLFILFPWFMYLNIRGTRYQTRPYLMDNYKYLFAFNLFSFIFFLIYFGAYLIQRISGTMELISAGSTWIDYLSKILLLLLGLIIALGWTGRIGLYLSNYKAFNLEMKGNPDRTVNPPSRKLVYLVVSILITLILSGVVFMTGVLDRGNTDVGRVLEKYTLEEDGGRKMYCTIELCKTDHTREYEVCCATTYEELPLGVLVKFECDPDNTITRLVDY